MSKNKNVIKAMMRRVVSIDHFQRVPNLVRRNNDDLNEKRLGASYGFKGNFKDATTGSPVTEIGYNSIIRLTYPKRSLW
jgi:hypothetical protein